MRIDSSHCGMVCKFTVTQDLELSDLGFSFFHYLGLMIN